MKKVVTKYRGGGNMYLRGGAVYLYQSATVVPDTLLMVRVWC